MASFAFTFSGSNSLLIKSRLRYNQSQNKGIIVTYKATKAKVKNRGIPPDEFLDELVEWGRNASDEIFSQNYGKTYDIYLSVWDTLGPYETLLDRRAVMLEVLRVLAGFESSWKWTAGVDITNKRSLSHIASAEAGAWQVSADSMGWSHSLKTLVLRKIGSTGPADFRRGMMHNHELAMEYIARLLRFTTAANGPVKDHRIDDWLSREAVKEFKHLLQQIGDFPTSEELKQTG
jgi:hypothetical protein